MTALASEEFRRKYEQSRFIQTYLIIAERTMKWKQWVEKWGLTGIQINAGFLNMEFEPQDPDRDAAWELYTELLTRVTT